MIRKAREVNLARVKIIGVGGGGSNAVSRMAVSKAKNLDLACINTDAQALDLMDVPTRICIGPSTTSGLGSGGDPSVGWKAAEESREALQELVSDADMIFVAAGMGGGTGTGAAPIVAQLAKEAGALTVGVVTKPFSFEGRSRMIIAEEGLDMLVEQVDTLIAIDNNRLLDACEYDLPMGEAFGMVDDVLSQGVQAIADIINVPGEINVDFADVRNVMKDGGRALMAIGTGEGEDRMSKATTRALSSPLLESSFKGATGIVLNITGGDDLTIGETNRAAEMLTGASNPDALVIFGVVRDKAFDGKVRVTLIATGLEMEHTVEDLPKGRVISAQPQELVQPVRERPNGFPNGARRVSNGSRFGGLFRKGIGARATGAFR